MNKILSQAELLEKYQVCNDYTSVYSNLVYPMDMGTKYKFYGYANASDVLLFLKDKFGQQVCRIQNKYAVPLFQVAYMNKLETFFYYQHDNKTWLISLSET